MTSAEHPHVDEWARLLDGEVTANRAAQMEAHAATCADCEREIAQLSVLIGELEQPAIGVGHADVSAIMRRLDDPPVASVERPRVWLYSGAAVASAAAVLLMVSLADRGASVQDTGTFTARGGATQNGSELSRKVGFRFLAGDSADTEIAEGASIASDTPLTAGYSNLMEQPAFALVFAVDSVGDVHWMYPAFTDLSTDPAAVELSPGQRAGQFGQTVVLEQPARGPMRLVTVVSTDALTVSSVEQLDSHSTDDLRRAFPRAAVTSTSIEVGP